MSLPGTFVAPSPTDSPRPRFASACSRSPSMRGCRPGCRPRRSPTRCSRNTTTERGPDRTSRTAHEGGTVTVGFIGLGRMGRGMASNIAAATDLVVYDVSADATAPLRELGAQVADSVGDLTRRSDVLFTSLPGPPEVEATVFGPDGILDNLRPGHVLFDLSTSSIAL